MVLPVQCSRRSKMPGPCKARRKTPSPAMPTAAAASTAAVPVNGANGVAGWAAAEFKNTECARVQTALPLTPHPVRTLSLPSIHLV